MFGKPKEERDGVVAIIIQEAIAIAVDANARKRK